jgi:hypothetical protein
MLMRFLLLTSLCYSMFCSAFCSRTKEEYTIPFGACVWSTGVAMHPLLKQVLMDFASMSFCTILYTDMQKVERGLNAVCVGLQLQQSMSEGTQTHFRSIVTDPYLRAVGSNGTIIAIGDGATVEQVGIGKTFAGLPHRWLRQCWVAVCLHKMLAN